MEINRIERDLHGIERLTRQSGARRANGSCEPRGGDTVELSSDATRLAGGGALATEATSFDAPHRAERVQEARERVATGFYEDNPAVREVVLARLVESILGLDQPA